MTAFDVRAPSPSTHSAPDLGGQLLDIIETWLASLPDQTPLTAPMGQIQTLLHDLRSDLGRKPRVVILGEFNSGKTTLANVLARTSALPTSVLSNTRQATVIQSDGDAPDRLLAPMKVMAAGARTTPTLVTPADLEHATTTARGPLLAACTIIDTAGIADPSFTDPATARLASFADIAIWCSPATQCWKASERAAWDSFATRPRWRNLLVVAGADMLRGPDDRNRVLTRLETDTGRRFDGIYPLSALDALAALGGDGGVVDNDMWCRSGASDLEAAVKLHATAAYEQRRNRAGRWAARLLRHLDRMDDHELARQIFLRLPRRGRPENLGATPQPKRFETRALRQLKLHLMKLRQLEAQHRLAEGNTAPRTTALPRQTRSVARALASVLEKSGTGRQRSWLWRTA